MNIRHCARTAHPFKAARKAKTEHLSIVKNPCSPTVQSIYSQTSSSQSYIALQKRPTCAAVQQSNYTAKCGRLQCDSVLSTAQKLALFFCSWSWLTALLWHSDSVSSFVRDSRISTLTIYAWLTHLAYSSALSNREGK